MSTSLYWRQTPEASKSNNFLPESLKAVLERTIMRDSTRTNLTVADIPWITGLHSAGVDGAEKLINVIKELGSIDLWTE